MPAAPEDREQAAQANLHHAGNRSGDETERPDGIARAVLLALAVLLVAGYVKCVILHKDSKPASSATPASVRRRGPAISAVKAMRPSGQEAGRLVVEWGTSTAADSQVVVDVKGVGIVGSPHDPALKKKHRVEVGGVSDMRDVRLLIISRDKEGRSAEKEVLISASGAVPTFSNEAVSGGKWEAFQRPRSAGHWIGCCDADADGSPEIAVVGAGARDRCGLFKWTGKEGQDVTKSVAPHLPPYYSRCSAWLDADANGLSDLICAWKTVEYFANAGGAKYLAAKPKPPAGLSSKGPYVNLLALDYDSDGLADLLTLDSSRRLRLYRNSGKKGFEEVTATLLPSSKTLRRVGAPDALTSVDVDGDGFGELIWNAGAVLVLRNAKGKAFEPVPLCEEKTRRRLAFFTAWADYDNDGDMDVLVPGGYPASEGPRLLRNDGELKFCDVTPGSGSLRDASSACRAAVWGDFNNDGLLDLYLLGMRRGHRLLVAEAPGRFLDPTDFSGLDDIDGRLVSAVALDYDRDGDLDVFALSSDRADFVLRNDIADGGNRPALLAVLNGAKGAVGARVSLLGPDGRLIALREVGNCSSMPGQSPAEAHFAAAPGKYKIRVRYTDGHTKEVDAEIPASGANTIRIDR